MTYGRVCFDAQQPDLDGAAVSHLAELVRGDSPRDEGPLIRPSGTFSPRDSPAKRDGGQCWLSIGARGRSWVSR